ncbi:hypothetical protein [uncultured Clostridium sp.]|uniref:hypothetical protein n=1 Tax=uncultured Clostridium sp. TaxID=59620 RepID=UPI0025CC9BEE|nr:hypothetical protein [uncultured Clostridium sp.]
MAEGRHKTEKIISSKYGRGNEFNDYVEGFTDEEGPDIRKNDEHEVHEYTMRIFPDPDW